MQTDYKMRVLTTIVSFLYMTLTLWGTDTLQYSPYKHVALSKQTEYTLPNITANAVNVYNYSHLKVFLGHAFCKQALSTDIGTLDNFSSSPRLCDAGNLLVSNPLFSRIETINEKFSVIRVPSTLESPSSVELAIPPPGDCPIFEALAKDLADPDKGPALNAFLDEFLTPNSVRVKAWEKAFNRNLPESWRKNIYFLEPYAKAIDEKLKIGLHMKGHIDNEKAVGCHLSSVIDNINVRLKSPQPNGLPQYFLDGKLKKAAIEIKDANGNWIPKDANSSFFPNGWDEDKILEEIAYVRAQIGNKLTERIWKGPASDGTQIQVEYTGPLNNLTFSTVFPIN